MTGEMHSFSVVALRLPPANGPHPPGMDAAIALRPVALLRGEVAIWDACLRQRHISRQSKGMRRQQNVP
jgi:hypothetical protein